MGHESFASCRPICPSNGPYALVDPEEDTNARTAAFGGSGIQRSYRNFRPGSFATVDRASHEQRIFYDGLVGVVVDAVPRARGKYTKMDGVKGQLRHPCSARYSQQYDARRRRPFVGQRHAARAAPALGPPPLCRKWLSVFLSFVRETNWYNWLRPRRVVSATALGASTKQKPLQ